MADLDCRIVAMLALALSLLSLSGVIFVRHHHHRAPYYHTPEAFMTERECLSCDSASSSSSSSSSADGIESVSEKDSSTNLIAHPHLHPHQPTNKTSSSSNRKKGGDFDISESCLQCICEAGTGCKPAICSGGLMCGIFRISKPYWIDAGSPTLKGVTYNEKDGSDSEKAYLQCVNNPFCAARAVKAYIGRYKRDCDGDGMIDCYDYAALHIQGPKGCKLEELSSTIFGRLYRCLNDFTLYTRN